MNSATIGFEEVCDDNPNHPFAVTGCVHYETPPPVTVTCPVIDPANASVQVFASGYQPDTGAWAIFTDGSGTVTVDTQVDSCGQAQASLPDGGVLTVIQTGNNTETINTYRAVANGDHVVVGAPSSTSGTQDTMLATFQPPTGATTAAFMTACGGGSWAKSNQPTNTDLTFYDACRTPTFDMLTIASIPYEPSEFVWQTGLTHVPYGNVSVATDWAPMGSASVTLANVPPNSPQMNTTWATEIGASSVQMSNLLIDPVAGDQTLYLKYPPGAGDGAVVNVDIETSMFEWESRSIVEDGAPTSVTIDFTTLPIPIVSSVQQTANGATWTETTGETADARSLEWRGTLSSGVFVYWYVTEPYDGLASSTLPGLPADHAAEDPTIDPGVQFHGAGVNYWLSSEVQPGVTLSHSAGGESVSFLF